MLAVVDRSDMAHLGFGYGFPGSFSGQLALVFGDPPGPFLWIYLLALAVAWVGFRDGKERAFLAGWMLAAIALLNPLLFPLVTSYLTSYNAFWRLFYLLPFLLAVGIAIAGLVDRFAVRRPAHHVLAIALLLGIAALGNLVEPFSSRAVFSRIPLAVTGYKIDADLQEDVRVILARAEPGAMLAPLHYSAVIPLFTAQLPQVAVRGFMLRHAAIANGDPELAESRMRAIGFVSGRASPGAAQDLAKLLAREELKNVVVSARVAARPQLLRLLAPVWVPARPAPAPLRALRPSPRARHRVVVISPVCATRGALRRQRYMTSKRLIGTESASRRSRNDGASRRRTKFQR